MGVVPKGHLHIVLLVYLCVDHILHNNNHFPKKVWLESVGPSNGGTEDSLWDIGVPASWVHLLNEVTSAVLVVGRVW